MKKIASLAPAPGLFLILLASCFLFVSCGKKSSPAACKLISIVYGSGAISTTYDITYNSSGQIATLQATGGNVWTKTYAYHGDQVMITTTTASPTGTGTDSIVVSGSNQILYSLSTDSSGNQTVDTYTYNSDGTLLSSTDQENGGAVTTTNYSFSNGDLSSSSNGITTITYSYYTDKAFADGDALKTAQLLDSGGLYIKNAHLVKTIQGGGVNNTFTYTFDSDGKIIEVAESSGSSIDTLSDQYDCA